MVALKQFAVPLIVVLLIAMIAGCQPQHDDLNQQSPSKPSTPISSQFAPFLDVTKEGIVEWERVDLNQLHSSGLLPLNDYNSTEGLVLKNIFQYLTLQVRTRDRMNEVTIGHIEPQ